MARVTLVGDPNEQAEGRQHERLTAGHCKVRSHSTEARKDTERGTSGSGSQIHTRDARVPSLNSIIPLRQQRITDHLLQGNGKLARMERPAFADFGPGRRDFVL